MRSHSLCLAAVNALGVSAFLIPAGIAPPEGIPDMSITVVNPKNQIIRLPCSACAFSPALLGDNSIEAAEKSDDMLWIQGGANDVLLNFTIAGDQTLELNGHAIFPFEGRAYFDQPQVQQVSSSASIHQVEKGEVRTTALDVTALAVGISGDEDITPFGDSLISMTYTILGLEDQPVTLSNVDIELLKTVEGELLILDLSSSPAQVQASEFVEPSAPHKHSAPCGSLPGPLCDIKNFVDSKIDSFRRPQHAGKPDCGGRRPHDGKLPGHIKPGFLHPEFAHEDFPPRGPFGDHESHSHHEGPARGGPPHDRVHHEGPPHGGPHHGRPHHPHRHRHSFFESLARGFVAIVVPTLIGVVVGVSISVFGLLIGRLVGFLWQNLVPGGQQGYQNLALDDDHLESAEHDEKNNLADEQQQENPPMYEDVPEYDTKSNAGQ